MSAELPPNQRALRVVSSGKLTLKTDCPLPLPASDEVLVQVTCVALNPHDAKSLDMSPSIGAVPGLDFAGKVVALGEGVPASGLPIGTRVCGCVHGNNPNRLDNGSFANYVAVPWRLVIRIPSAMSDQQAATLTTGLATAGFVLYHSLELPLPTASRSETEKPTFVLLYGGGTATATLIVQLLRRSGLSPLATASSPQSQRLKELGAEAVFDHNSPTCGLDIREFTQHNLTFAIDCITDTRSMKICYESIGPKGGRYITLNPFPLHLHTRRSIRPDWVYCLTQFGEAINMDPPFNFLARPKDKAFAEKWYAIVEQLLVAGQITSHPYQERQGGLLAVIDDIDELHKGRVRGKKLVYPIDNHPLLA